MVRRNTWMLVALLLALVALSFYLRERKANAPPSATPTASMANLFDGEQGGATRIRVQSSLGLVVDLRRDSSGKWIVDAPQRAEADQAAAEAAATQVGALRVLATVDLEGEIVGLDKPEYTLTIGFGDAPEHKLLVGSRTPIQDGYYVRLDGGPVQVADKSGLDELTGLLENPPVPATSTAEASATAGVTPTVSASEAAPAPEGTPAVPSNPEQAPTTPAP